MEILHAASAAQTMAKTDQPRKARWSGETGAGRGRVIGAIVRVQTVSAAAVLTAPELCQMLRLAGHLKSQAIHATTEVAFAVIVTGGRQRAGPVFTGGGDVEIEQVGAAEVAA